MYVKSCSLSFQRMPGRFDHDGSQNDAGESAEGRVEAPSWACLLLIVSGSSGFPPPPPETSAQPRQGWSGRDGWIS